MSQQENADFGSIGDHMHLMEDEDGERNLEDAGKNLKGANKAFYEDLIRHQKILNELINNRP